MEAMKDIQIQRDNGDFGYYPEEQEVMDDDKLHKELKRCRK